MITFCKTCFIFFYKKWSNKSWLLIDIYYLCTKFQHSWQWLPILDYCVIDRYSWSTVLWFFCRTPSAILFQHRFSVGLWPDPLLKSSQKQNFLYNGSFFVDGKHRISASEIFFNGLAKTQIFATYGWGSVPGSLHHHWWSNHNSWDWDIECQHCFHHRQLCKAVSSCLEGQRKIDWHPTIIVCCV